MAEVRVTAKTADPRVGIRITPAMASITAAATTTMLHQVTPGRTAKIRKLIWNNRNAATGKLRIGSTDSATGGTGGVFTQRIPEVHMPAGQHGTLTEEELAGYEFRLLADVNTDIVAQSTVGAASPNDVQVQAEVEEFGEQ